MKKIPNRTIAVLGIVCSLITAGAVFLPADSEPGPANSQAIASVEGLRDELRDAQLLALPVADGHAGWDGGDYLFNPPLGDLSAISFLASLVPVSSGGGYSWPVTLFEDPVSRETVILNAAGEEAARLPCEPDYDPAWAFDMLSPLSRSRADADAYDPARVELSLRLVLQNEWLEMFTPGPDGTGGAGLVNTGGRPSHATDPGQAKVSATSNSPAAYVPMTAGETTMAANDNKHADKPSTNSMLGASGRKSGGRSSKTLYVDRLKGCDAWSGRSPSVSAVNSAEGPRRTIRAGLAAASKKELLVIRGGNYSEGINVRGHKGDVVIHGDVRLGKAYENASAASAAFSMRRKDASVAPTGTVARVTQ